MRWTSSTLVLGTSLWAGCAGSVISEPEPVELGSIDEYIRSLPPLPSPAAQVIEGEQTDDVREGDYSCSATNLRETRQFDKIVAYNTNSESLWPGSILAGDSVYTGQFKQLVFARQPLTVSVSLENLAGAKSAMLQEPSLSASREAISGILSSAVSGATPANIYTEIEKVSSQKQLAIALGADVKLPGAIANIGASFHFDDSTVKSRYVVKYTQAYYTVDVDQPARPSDFFAPSVGVADLRKATNADSPPVYVSSITYGRTIIFTIESQYAGVEVDSALRFAYSAGAEISGATSVKYKEIVESSKINAFILGGSGGDAARSIDSYEGLIEFIKSGGNYSKESPGAAIAYKLAYLSDNAPARLSFTTDYQLKDCVRVSQKVKVTLKHIKVEIADDSGGDLEIHGKITAEGDTAATLFDFGRDHFFTIKAGEQYPADGTNLGEGIIQVTPNKEGVIRLHATLVDQDPIAGNDLGDKIELVPFERGWRQDVPVRLSGSGSTVLVTIALQPI